MSMIELFQYLEEELRNASSLPLTGKRLVDADKCVDIIADLQSLLPEEVKKAEEIVASEARILDAAHQRADQMHEQAEQAFRERVNDHDVTRQARQEAQYILQEARKEAREIRLDAMQYCDDLLAEMEKNAAQLQSEIRQNRASLQNRTRQEGTRPTGERRRPPAPPAER